jgi:hypothetical protein
VLSLCQRSLALAKQGLHHHGGAGVDPATLERFVHAIERVQKVQKEVFGQLAIES